MIEMSSGFPTLLKLWLVKNPVSFIVVAEAGNNSIVVIGVLVASLISLDLAWSLSLRTA